MIRRHTFGIAIIMAVLGACAEFGVAPVETDAGRRPPEEDGGDPPGVDASREDGPEDAEVPEDADADVAHDSEPPIDVHTCPPMDVELDGDGLWTLNGVSEPLRESGVVVGLRNTVTVTGNGNGSSVRTREFQLDARCPLHVKIVLRDVQPRPASTLQLVSVRWPESDGEGVTVGFGQSGSYQAWAQDCFVRTCTVEPTSLHINPLFPSQIDLRVTPSEARVTVGREPERPEATTFSPSYPSSIVVVQVGVRTGVSTRVDYGAVTTSFGD